MRSVWNTAGTAAHRTPWTFSRYCVISVRVSSSQKLAMSNMRRMARSRFARRGSPSAACDTCRRHGGTCPDGIGIRLVEPASSATCGAFRVFSAILVEGGLGRRMVALPELLVGGGKFRGRPHRRGIDRNDLSVAKTRPARPGRVRPGGRATASRSRRTWPRQGTPLPTIPRHRLIVPAPVPWRPSVRGFVSRRSARDERQSPNPPPQPACDVLAQYRPDLRPHLRPPVPTPGVWVGPEGREALRAPHR